VGNDAVVIFMQAGLGIGATRGCCTASGMTRQLGDRAARVSVC
jgi:hypothetical protein